MGSKRGVNVAENDEDQVPREREAKTQQKSMPGKCMPGKRMPGELGSGPENREVSQI